MSARSVSIVMPIFNEEDLLAELVTRTTRVMNDLESSTGLASEWVLVNDGSRDTTLEQLREYALHDSRIAVLDLSRNFGHQPAIQAGLEYAHGDAVIILDGDLQDPPELIPEMVRVWMDGNKVVVAQRRSRAEGGLKGLLFKGFHAMLAKVSDLKMETGSGVFGLLDRRVVGELLRLHERNRFFPGLRTWVGYKQATVLYDRDKRAGGEAKQTLGRLFRYAFDAIFSFSFKPLRAIWTMGFIISMLSIAYGLYLVILRILHINVVSGFTTPTVAILLLGGIQLIAIGVLGEYLARIYDEVKQRPHYVINEIITAKSVTEAAEHSALR
jgi:glycosyltransferase involved in cell wall biosynthesis